MFTVMETGTGAIPRISSEAFRISVTCGLNRFLSKGMPLSASVLRIRRTTAVSGTESRIPDEQLDLKKIYARNRKRPGRSKYLLSVEDNLIQKEKGRIISRIPVRIIFVRNRANRKDWIALISTDMEISEKEIIRRYGVRWNIEVFFKTCKQYLKMLKECNSPSFDALTCHLAVVCVRYMILSVYQRSSTDDRTIGELFWLITAEVAEISFNSTLALILEALLDTIREFFSISDKQMDKFYVAFLGRLPKHLRTALGISQADCAA